MNTLTIVGLGPGRLGQLTKEAENELLAADKVFFRTGAHPIYKWLEQRGKHVACFDRLYALPWKEGGDIYEFIVAALLKEATLRDKVTYALPGSPVFLEDTTKILRERGNGAGVEVRLVHGLSFVEEALGMLNLDFSEGLQIVLPRAHLKTGRFTKELALLVCQIEARRVSTDEPRVDLTMKWLLGAFPPDHLVTLIWTDGLPDYKTQALAMELKNLVWEYGNAKYYSSLYVPPL
jgi:tetrapyrrole methylase family protein / MazG family protein